MALRLVSRMSSRVRSKAACSRPFSAMVYADHDNISLSSSTLNSISAALQLDPEVDVVVAGKDCGAVAEQVSKVTGVKSVLQFENDAFSHQIAENVTSLVVDLQKEKGYSYIIGSATALGKNVMPRVAAALDVALVSDVIAIKSADTFVRPVYAGNALATVKSLDSLKVLTVRATSFEAANHEGGSAAIEKVDKGGDAGMTTWTRDELSVSERPELASAKVVVAGGRGVGSAENFGILNELADHLGAAVGASRAAVDAGYAPNDMQVGQTGKVVAPDLYIAAGISGAIQHLAGMKDSKTIVAINQDPEAAIFQVADYGLKADLFEAIPALSKKIAADKQ